jgi:GT2 family glycosyltransferase
METTLIEEREAGPAAPRGAGTPAGKSSKVVAADLSIVIVTWNSERWITRCLRSLPAACEGVDYDVVVYDNGSRDATLPLIAQEGVRVIPSASNDGFAAATNRGIAATTGRYVVLLNPDCELDPRALTALFEFMESTPAAAAAVPLLSDNSGVSQREFQLRRIPTLWSLAAEVLAVGKIFPNNRWTASYRYRDLALKEPSRVDQPAAAAMLLRRDVYDRVGPLDEQFSPAWFEDVDYCRRLAAAGDAIYVVPAAHGRHFGGSSLEHLGFATFTSIWYRNMFRYARKWFTPGQAEALRWVIISAMLLRLPAALLGLAHRDAGRVNAMRAYIGVMKKAFERWDDSPASS